MLCFHQNILKYVMTEAKERKQTAFENDWTVSSDEVLFADIAITCYLWTSKALDAYSLSSLLLLSCPESSTAVQRERLWSFCLGGINMLIYLCSTQFMLAFGT